MGWFNKKLQQIQKKPQSVAPRPKKGKCKIKFKKTTDGEAIEFSPECSSQQIEMAKQMRADKHGEEHDERN